MQLAQDMQPADSRNSGETDLDLVTGQMICCCNIIDTPCRIELHFVSGTGIKFSFNGWETMTLRLGKRTSTSGQLYT